eukprot:6585067-Prymnesium_polylepis.1
MLAFVRFPWRGPWVFAADPAGIGAQARDRPVATRRFAFVLRGVWPPTRPSLHPCYYTFFTHTRWRCGPPSTRRTTASTARRPVPCGTDGGGVRRTAGRLGRRPARAQVPQL